MKKSILIHIFFSLLLLSFIQRNTINAMQSNDVIDVINNTKSRWYLCTICDKNVTNLTRHKRKHTGEKPFACDICSKNFSERSGLAKHMPIHTKEKSLEKPFACEGCGKGFTTNGHLKKHISTIHMGIKPYVYSYSFSCALCDQVFKQKYNLQRHMQVHARRESFPCITCNKKFCYKKSFITHMALVHPQKKSFTASSVSKIEPTIDDNFLEPLFNFENYDNNSTYFFNQIDQK
jgi:KRAB domain-containing zinc finger protein